MARSAPERTPADDTSTQRHDPPFDATCGERVAILGVAHACRLEAHEGDVHICVCGCEWWPRQRGCEPTTAPVTAEGLRERLDNGLDRLVYDVVKPIIIDAVVAALAGDPGDLPARMAAELRRHTTTEPDALVCACGAQTLDWDVHLAEVATSVRWEDHAATVARLAHAEEQMAALRDHNTRWETAEARLDQLRAYAHWCNDRSVEPETRDLLAIADGREHHDYVILMKRAAQ